MFTSSSFSISNEDGEEGDESEDEVDDDVPWRSSSDKIAYANTNIFFFLLLDLIMLLLSFSF